MTQERQERPPLPEPRDADRAWPEKVKTAKEAREAGREARKGQPAGFPDRRSLAP
jgi:hypothetical protein